MKPFLAMITPLTDAGGQPPTPPGIWGGSNEPFPGYGLPEGGKPPGSPPGIWGGSNEPFPGYGLPGRQPGGIWGGGNAPFPTPPIVIPPENPGDPPLVIWGGGNAPFPTPPIELPGAGTPPPGGEPQRLFEWKTAWSEQTGWVVVGVPKGAHPAPSK